MAETKKKKIVSASTGKTVKEGERKKATVKKQAAPVGNATGLRVGAIVLWVLALAFEFLAWFVFIGKVNFTFLPSMVQLIAFLVLDLVCVIIGSLLWKKANHIDPVSLSALGFDAALGFGAVFVRRLAFRITLEYRRAFGRGRAFDFFACFGRRGHSYVFFAACKQRARRHQSSQHEGYYR